MSWPIRLASYRHHQQSLNTVVVFAPLAASLDTHGLSKIFHPIIMKIIFPTFFLVSLNSTQFSQRYTMQLQRCNQMFESRSETF